MHEYMITYQTHGNSRARLVIHAYTVREALDSASATGLAHDADMVSIVRQDVAS